MNTQGRHFLGRRAFILFLLRRIKFSLFLFGLTWFVWYSERWVLQPYFDWVEYATKLLLLLSAAYFLLVFLRTYFEYHCYTYTFTKEAFIMTNGYIVRNEIAAVYHQIQNVNIKRTALDRFMGVSQLVIVMAGLEREGHRTQIILPGVGKAKAKWVQKELLMRAREHVGPAIDPPEEE